MLFIDFSSTLNTVIPQNLVRKCGSLGINIPLCNHRPQTLRVGKSISEAITMITGVTRCSVLSSLLSTLMTHDCCAKYNLNHSIKFIDDTMVVCLISRNNNLVYREEVNLSYYLVGQHQPVTEHQKDEGDHLRNHMAHNPLIINGNTVKSVRSTKFLGMHIADDRTWTTNTTSLVKRAGCSYSIHLRK